MGSQRVEHDWVTGLNWRVDWLPVSLSALGEVYKLLELHKFYSLSSFPSGFSFLARWGPLVSVLHLLSQYACLLRYLVFLRWFITLLYRLHSRIISQKCGDRGTVPVSLPWGPASQTTSYSSSLLFKRDALSWVLGKTWINFIYLSIYLYIKLYSHYL